MPWVRACATDDLAEGEAVAMHTEPPIAVFNVDGEYLAIDDTCSHDRYSLAEGYIEGDQVECGWHFAKFCLRTGRAMSLPATKHLRSHAVRIEGPDLMVEVPAGAPAQVEGCGVAAPP